MRRRASALSLSSAPAFGVLVFGTLVLGTIAAGGHAQEELGGVSSELGIQLDEERAWSEARQGNHIEARELAEAVVRERPSSFVGQLVLGYVHHYGEANVARALYHVDRARALFTQQHGAEPVPPAPWRWHARILRELAMVHGDLENYEEQLRFMALYSELYEPDFIAERAWPFMKMRRFDEAREAVNLGRATGDPRQLEIALNASCAIEFEAGNDAASYQACREAMELHGADPTVQGAVDFTNFAEAARSVFRLDEAERVDLLATEAQVSWYGNPWVELAELYVREGRFPEALDALRRIDPYRSRRPPHVRNADRNEARRALASFFVVVGRGDDAAQVAQKALNAPDRRGHNSRDPEQDRAIAALLHRSGARLRAERRAERTQGSGFFKSIGAWFENVGDRWNAWLSGRVAARSLADEERLVGTFMIGTHRSAVMPPWLAGDLVEVLGAGVVREAVRRARAEDDREGAGAYYDAFEAEAALSAGDPVQALELASRSLAELNPAEALLRARMFAVVAESSRQLDDVRRATEAYGRAFQMDPGVFRRMGWSVPARFEVRGSDTAEGIADRLESGPRFSSSDWGMTVQVEADRAGGTVCLLAHGGAVIACADATAEADGESSDEFEGRLANAFLEQAFAPRVDLSQADANGLDGSNRVSRNPLETLFGEVPLPRDPDAASDSD